MTVRSARPTDQFGAAMLGMRGIQRSSRNKATTSTESLLCSKHPFVPHGPAHQFACVFRAGPSAKSCILTRQHKGEHNFWRARCFSLGVFELLR
jgi:hypothetical protein